MSHRSPMRMLRGLLRGARQVDEDIDLELSFHIEGRIDELIEAGWPEAEARREVARRFGDRAAIVAQCRRASTRRTHERPTGEGVMGLLDGVRRAWRALAARPGFTAVAAGTLALGIGANTAIFGVVHAVVLDPLPYPDPGSLVAVWPEAVTNVRTVEWLSEHTRSFTGLSGASSFEAALTGESTQGGGHASERVRGARVSPGHFDVLGTRPLLGRSFRPDEADPARARVVVLGHALWRSRYGADPDILGRTIRIDYADYTVIGVMPPGHRPVDGRARLWIPQEVEAGATVASDGTWWVGTRVARLTPGVAVEAAREDLRAVALDLAERFPEHLDRRQASLATVAPLRSVVVGSYGRSLWILLGGAGLVLLIACSNVANLLLARAAARAGDMAVRTALGATRRQVVGHMLAEGLVLGVLGGAGGLALAWVALSRVQALAPADLPRLDEVGMSAATLIFVVAASLLTPLVFGLVPALRAAALDVRGVLARGGRSPSVDHGRGRLAAALIAAETALSLILVIGAALLARSVWNLQGVDPGFRAAGVLTFQVTVPPPPGGPAADAPDLYDELWRTIASVQGVEASGGIHVLPLGAGNNRYPFWAEDNEPPAGSLAPVANIRVATPGYLDALGIGLLEGRWFAVDDRMEATPVLALNRTLARRLWPGESALGKRVRLLDGNAFEWEVVGVIEDVRQMALASEPSAEIYLPHAQWGAPGGAMFVTVRSAGRAEAPWPGLERAIQALDPGIVTARVATMEQVVSASLAAPRFLAGLVTTFGALALALAAVGVYGVMSQAVGRRVPELGIRMALGSSRAQALRVSMARGLLPVGVGLAVGLCAAWGATRVLGALLYGVEATDPLTYAAVAAMLATVATLACWLPAWRAVRAAPLAALREG